MSVLQLVGDWVKDFQNATATVLDLKTRVVVYSGKEDFICNYIGGEEWVNSTKWSGQVWFSIWLVCSVLVDRVPLSCKSVVLRTQVT